jgi:quercetin dioxygenase-like cupin family protein
VAHEETLIGTKGTLRVRFDGGEQVVRAGEIVALSKGTRVVYRGEEDGTEVVFVTHAHRADLNSSPPASSESSVRPLNSVPRLVASKPAA